MDLFELADVMATQEFGGRVKVVLHDGLQSNLTAGVYCLEPGERLAPDVHESDEVFYVLSGELTVRNDKGDENVKARAGQMVRIPEGQVHLSSNEGNGPVTVVWVFGRSRSL